MSPQRGSRPNGAFAALSRPPEATWPEGVIHHGIRILFLLGLAALATLLNPLPGDDTLARYTTEMIAQEDVLARVPFDVPLSGTELDRARNEARASVPVTFDERPQATDSMTARLDLFLGRIAAAATSENGAAAVTRLLSDRSIEASPSQVELFLDPEEFGRIRTTALDAISDLLPLGVADGPDLREISTPTVTVRSPDGMERSRQADEILSAPDFYGEAVSRLPPGASPDVQEILRLLLIQHVEFTYRLNTPATDADRESAARAVPTIRRSYLQNEAIVRSNDQITPEILEALTAHQNALASQGLLSTEEGRASFAALGGSWLLNVLLLGVFGMLVFLFRKEVYTNFRWILLVAILIAVYFGAESIVLRSGWPVEALPIAFVALSVAILWDGRMALVLVMTLAVISGLQPGFTGMNALVPTLLGGAAGALSVRAVRRRSQTWIFIAIIAAAYAAGILSAGLITGRDGASILIALGAAAGNTILSAIVAMGFLPVYEWFTGITSEQTLLEWADPHRSLLKRLSMEAPGTYAHSINVANLAENAADEIGANSLLCRVGMYYHDVGKMLKPHYFVENQPDGRNPHDRLKPDTSAAIVKAHVTEGARLAREAKVPDVIVDFIEEHHGDQRIGFFWEKAKTEFGEDQLNVADFTYPGPKPRSRETAIAMLADSVESATRALQDPTPERIVELIDGIVDGKIAAGQLEDAPLTFQELTRIKAQFAKVLGGVHHQRIDYPQTRHLTESRGGAAAASAATPAEGVGAEAAAASESAPAVPSEPEAVAQDGDSERPARSGRPADESQLDLAGDLDEPVAAEPDEVS